MRPIFLLGFMCSGKTTLGRALAEHTGRRFVDLDEHIEQAEGMTIRQIFAERGEAAFRQAESQALAEACRLDGAIVACGGGTPCRPGAIEAMNAAGLTVWLQPNDERLQTRLMEGRHKRPLIAAITDPEDMRQLAHRMLAEREPFYSRALARFDSSYLETPDEIADSVARFVRLWMQQ